MSRLQKNLEELQEKMVEKDDLLARNGAVLDESDTYVANLQEAIQVDVHLRLL
jgi:hypothetical protein